MMAGNLPLSRVKIDRSLTARVSDSSEAQAIVRTTIDLTRNFGFELVANGIETILRSDALLAETVAPDTGMRLRATNHFKLASIEVAGIAA